MLVNLLKLPPPQAHLPALGSAPLRPSPVLLPRSPCVTPVVAQDMPFHSGGHRPPLSEHGPCAGGGGGDLPAVLLSLSQGMQGGGGTPPGGAGPASCAPQTFAWGSTWAQLGEGQAAERSGPGSVCVLVLRPLEAFTGECYINKKEGGVFQEPILLSLLQAHPKKKGVRGRKKKRA